MEGNTKLDTMANAAAAAIRAARAQSESDQSGGSTGSPVDTAKGVSSAHRPRLAAKRTRSGAANGSVGTSAGGSGRPVGGGKAPRSHVATEQRRRDRINEGFEALRELIPHKDKLDKAAFLQKTIDYIGHMQGVLKQLLELGVVSTLSEDLQWTIRMLVPRDGPGDKSCAENSAAAQAPPPPRFTSVVPAPGLGSLGAGSGGGPPYSGGDGAADVGRQLLPRASSPQGLPHRTPASNQPSPLQPPQHMPHFQSRQPQPQPLYRPQPHALQSLQQQQQSLQHQHQHQQQANQTQGTGGSSSSLGRSPAARLAGSGSGITGSPVVPSPSQQSAPQPPTQQPWQPQQQQQQTVPQLLQQQQQLQLQLQQQQQLLQQPASLQSAVQFQAEPQPTPAAAQVLQQVQANGLGAPSEAASVQSLQALLASVPASQLHSALASVLAKANQPTDVPATPAALQLSHPPPAALPLGVPQATPYPGQQPPSAQSQRQQPQQQFHPPEQPWQQLQQAQHAEPGVVVPVTGTRPQSHHRQHPRHDLLQIQQQHKLRAQSSGSAPQPPYQAVQGPLRSTQLSSSDETTSLPGGQVPPHSAPLLRSVPSGCLQQQASAKVQQQASGNLHHQPSGGAVSPHQQQQPPQVAAPKQLPEAHTAQNGDGKQGAAVPDPVAAAGLALSGLDPTTLQHMAAWFAANAQAQQQQQQQEHVPCSGGGGSTLSAAAASPPRQQQQPQKGIVASPADNAQALEAKANEQDGSKQSGDAPTTAADTC